MTGTASFTSIVTIVEALPPELLAVTVYAVDGVIAVGVPEIAPVDVSSDRPTGSAGETDHDVTVPPVDVGVIAVIVTFFVKVRLLTP